MSGRDLDLYKDLEPKRQRSSHNLPGFLLAVIGAALVVVAQAWLGL